MDRTQLTRWVQAYERAWRSPGTEALASIFTEDASYLQSPYHSPVIGLPAIAQMWEDERTGPDETFQMTHAIVAVDGDTAVVRVEVHYGEPADQEYRDLWIIRFAEDGRCRSFEEWPFWPSRAITADHANPQRQP
ncbi:nuclear transport factor 2 family protein [Phytoactinopolyspora alkaliphila]|uniref:Nuclear transport factor 2 family protein n=1 Tax=Phytoactinopolyspora alkaliphila TaxID=1783498 RepID=A0A6N9YS73_9ACTN|nr:nuclear transport factor 2 family protein [Phytoactinopolyspora alkaliphila]NED97800.1 nuclear transport factor 2 family protein [Phytoactinopolyspora alkaliphila]